MSASGRQEFHNTGNRTSATAALPTNGLPRRILAKLPWLPRHTRYSPPSCPVFQPAFPSIAFSISTIKGIAFVAFAELAVNGACNVSTRSSGAA